jgi:hypothetical protein
MNTADEDMGVICARMTALVAERRVLALLADLQRASRSGQLVAAVSAQAEHAICIGRASRR